MIEAFRHNRLSNLILVLIFCVGVFSPIAVGLLQVGANVSEMEKRTLAKFPKWPSSVSSAQEFPQMITAYYADHFGLRYWLIKIHSRLKLKANNPSTDDVTVGKNGWLFLGSIKYGYERFDDPVGDAVNRSIYTKQRLELFAKNISAMNDWLKQRGVEYVFVIAPNKHTIYFDELPDYLTKINAVSSTDQLVDFLKSTTDVRVLDLRSALLKAKSEKPLYYKTGTHWNYRGANIAQYEIMKEIETLFPNKITPDLKRLKYNPSRGDTALANWLGRERTKTNNPMPVFENDCKLLKKPMHHKPRETHLWTCDDQKLSTVIFRDSYFDALQPYFIRKFKRSTFIWSQLNYPLLKKYIEKEKPDIVIEEWVERNLPANYTSKFLKLSKQIRSP